MHDCRLALPLLALAVLSAAASAQSLTVLVSEGDAVPGVGLVTRIDGVEINSMGAYLVEVDTDNADTDADSVLLGGSGVFLREGQALSAPAGSSLGSFDGVSLAPDGSAALNLFLDGTGATTNNSGVFLGDQLLIQESDVSTAPEFAPGTIYTGFFDVQVRDTGSLLVMASVDDPTIPTSTDRAIVALTIDAAGNVIGENVLLKEGDVPVGQTEPIADFETGTEEFTINTLGLTMYSVDLAGDTSVDRAVYRGGTLLMQEGSPSPVAGRSWGSLTSVELDLNDLGSWVAKANLDNSDTSNDLVIVRDGAIYRQEGDSLPAIAPFTFQDFGGSNGVFILPNGDVLWFGDWDDPDTSRDEGLFLNDELILQEGVTVIGGDTVVDLADFTETLQVSKDGGFAIIEGEINRAGTDLNVAIQIELGTSAVYCTSNPNSTGVAASLTITGSTSVAANSTTLSVGQMPALSFGFFITSQTQGFASMPGGSSGNLCLGGSIGRYVGPGQIQQSDLAGFMSLDIDLTQTPQPTGFVSVQAGEMWNFQAWYRDTSPSGPTSNFTDGVTLVFGP